jgi:uncharacterized membrane protein (UPF0127 family)
MDLLLKRIQAHHKIVKPLLFIGIMGLTFLFSVWFGSGGKSDFFEHELTVRVSEGLELDTDVSSTSNERTIGLSKYQSLNDNQAMLFVFDELGLYSFWMRDMNFPIDIIWLNENKEIISIKEGADPSEYPQSYYPEGDSLYVLETVAGFVRKNNLQKGQKLSW